MRKGIGIFIASTLLCGLGLCIKPSQKAESVKAEYEPVTLTSNLVYDFNNLSVGVVSGDTRKLVDDKGVGLSNVSLSMFNSSDLLDDNVSLKFSANESNYASDNYIRNKYSGYLQLRFPGTTDHDGGGIAITPKNASIKITSITVSLNSRTFSQANSQNSYEHIVLNNSSSFSKIGDLGYSASNLSKTWTETDGISYFGFAISRASDSSGGTDDKFIDIQTISVTYIKLYQGYDVTFDTQGGSSVESQFVQSGQSATKPADPTKPNSGNTTYTFDGWYTEATGGSAFNFNSGITADTTIYAHWKETTITGYTMTFETFGGTEIEPQVVPTDGTLFTKPADPTKASDGVYAYSFHKWYSDEACTVTYDFNTVPTGDITIYAGFIKQGYAPSGYKTIDPKHDASKWEDVADLQAGYGAWNLDSYSTFDSKMYNPQMELIVTQNGHTDSGAKLISTSEVRVNNAKIQLKITDQTKYFAAFRIEFAVKDYVEANKQTATLSTGGVVCDSGDTPWNSTSHAGLVLIGDCSSKPQEFTTNIPYISSNGTRLRYVYVQFGTYTDAEMAEKYAVQFNDDAVCGTSANDGLDSTKWGSQESNYLALTEETRSYLTAYDWQNGENDELNECLERYDRVIYLHGEDYDFMGRVAAGKVTPIANTNSFKLNNGTSENSSVIVIVVCAISVSTLGLLIVCKRKRQLLK